tara:strand:+ start:4581 stop:5507 length:927 start_codon:yes stop_codon:yes gene_type:complete
MSLPISLSRPQRTKKSPNFFLNDTSRQKFSRKRKTLKIADEEKSKFLNELFSKAPVFEILGKKNVEKFFINKYEIAYSRSIMGDFITLLQKEGINPENKEKNDISSTIKEDCMNNFQIGDQKCFCCGKDIEYTEKDGKKFPKDVACDHVVPIITMLMTITPNTVKNNLHFIHTKCNSKKLNKNIFETYLNIGKKNGIFLNEEDNSEYCKNKFLNILSKLEFRDDINLRISYIKEFQKKMNELKSFYLMYLDDKSQAAQILTAMKKDNRFINSTSASTSTSKSKSLSPSRKRTRRSSSSSSSISRKSSR